MTERYSSRKRIGCTASIASEGLHGQGQVVDLSVPGCLLETDLPLKVGQAIQLKLMFSCGKPLGVTLAVIRWVDGWKAGAEFIRMSDEDQARLRLMVGYAEKRRVCRSAWSERAMWTGISGV